MPERRGHRLKGVYAARTVEAPQPRFDFFLNRLAKNLGIVATVRTAASTHVTLLESCGVKDLFYDLDFTARDVRQFSRRMQKRIDRAGHYRSPMRARVNPDEPLRWVGYPPPGAEQSISTNVGPGYLASTLALGLVLDERLKDQRGIIEGGLVEEFGELPPIRDFSPHISIASIRKPWRDQFCQQEASDLLPRSLSLPRSIALNGLAVYLDKIHDPDSAVA